MKKTLKLTSILIALLLAFALLPLTACKDDVSEQKIMNLSLNPKVEFILDEDDKVVTVNALNEEGNLIISAEAFVNVEGMSAEEAAKLFVKVTEESGFIVKGSLGENELQISITGDAENAQNLYDSIKGEVNSYLSSIDIEIEIEKVKAYTEAELEAIVAEVCLYLDEEEIEALDYQQLIKELENSRKETKEYYSQELKNAYYAMKSVAIQKAELNAIKESAGALVAGAISATEALYDSAVNALIEARLELVNPEGAYQLALADLRAKKVAFLDYRRDLAESEVEIDDLQTAYLNNLETALNSAESALISAGESANALMSTLEQAIKTQYDTVISTLETLGVELSTYLDEISAKQTTALNQFATDFETTYASAIAKAESDWTAMYGELTETTPE